MSDKNITTRTVNQMPSRNDHDDRSTTSSSAQVVTQGLQQQEGSNKKKKKCRGDRKMQRLRRQLYAKGLDSVEVAKLVEEKRQQQDNEEPPATHVTQNLQVYIPLDRITLPDLNSGTSVDSIEMTPKRKRLLLTPTPTSEAITILDQPLSQLSISQRNPKRTKTITTTDQLHSEINEPRIHPIEKFQPRYLKVSDQILKQMLSNAIENGHRTIQCLDTTEKLHFIRQIMEITNDFYFKDLQRQLWQEYCSCSLKDKNWESTVTKQYSRQHNTCRMYRPRRSSIEKRQAKIAHQIQQIGNELQQYLLKLQEYSTQWQPSVDPDTVSHAINECVKNGQRRLKDEFDYKKEMLTLDWNDHYLINKFYELKPNEKLIELAKQIWETTANELRTKEQLEILRQRIFLKRIPSKTDKMVNELLTDNQKTLSNPFLQQKQRASFASRCSKTIVQCKFNLMIVEIDEFETIIRHHHRTLNSLQDKLSKLNKENPHIYSILLMDTIEERRQAMINRFIRIRQHKLKTFFDEAPAVDNNN